MTKRYLYVDFQQNAKIYHLTEQYASSFILKRKKKYSKKEKSDKIFSFLHLVLKFMEIFIYWLRLL